MIHLPHPATAHLPMQSMWLIASKPAFYLLPTPPPEGLGYFSNLFPHYISPPLSLRTYSPMKVERTECSETLSFKLQTLVNNPKANIWQSEHTFGDKNKETMFTGGSVSDSCMLTTCPFCYTGVLIYFALPRLWFFLKVALWYLQISALHWQ
jgi:hypothetical protein